MFKRNRSSILKWTIPVYAGCLLSAGCGTPSGRHVNGPRSQPLQTDKATADRPLVLLIGDSISMQDIGYFSDVVERLGDRFRVVHNPGNGGDSANVLTHLDEWLGLNPPDIVHFNCGLHDLRFDRTKRTHQQPPDAYENNLREICRRLKSFSSVRLIFALTTPVNDEWHQARKPYDRLNADVMRYNRIARKIMDQHAIPVNDLHAVIVNADPDSCLTEDGVHMNEKGNRVLSQAVAAAIERLMEMDGKGT